MRRYVLLSLCLVLSGCAGFDGTHTAPAFQTPEPVATADRTVLRQVIGQDMLDQPLLPQPGNIWADILPPSTQRAASTAAARVDHPVTAMAPATQLPHAAAPKSATVAAAAPLLPPSMPAVTKAVPAQASRPVVQLAAARSPQRAAAEWRRLRLQAPKLTDGHLPAVIEAEVNGQQVWRLRTAGFADVAEASAFCTGIRAVRADCWVVPMASLP
jgi:hypothetical protein